MAEVSLNLKSSSDHNINPNRLQQLHVFPVYIVLVPALGGKRPAYLCNYKTVP